MATKKQKTSAKLAYREPILKIAKKYGATKVKVFGSYARNTQTKKSDMDFVVNLPKKSTLLDMSGMKIDLAKALKKRVDLITYNGIKPALRSNILREAKPL